MPSIGYSSILIPCGLNEAAYLKSVVLVEALRRDPEMAIIFILNLVVII
jgi:hypothetical protein